MPDLKSINIVGGGLAGLTLGIGLRRQGVPVTLHEAGDYPRHRVCGEFISGRGQAVLANLGLDNLLAGAGAIPARTLSFHSSRRSTAARPLPVSAICVSRHALDAALARHFQSLGGVLQTGRRCPDVGPREGWVQATGRVPSLTPSGERWFGLKIHARGVTTISDLEMHFSALGYVGICSLGQGVVNVCGLFRRRPGSVSLPRTELDWLQGPAGSPLSERLAHAEFDLNSLCAVAGLSLAPRRATALSVTAVGDAITMIPPVTGNGMSMAFESAALAVAPLTAWSRGNCSWTEAQTNISAACDRAFHHRLRSAQWLQRLVLTPALHDPLIRLAGFADAWWRLAFERTR